MYICPVCGYDQLRRPPENFVICVCCCTEFGYSDAGISHDELRAEWLAKGARWMGINVTPPPINWNPIKQLKNLNKKEEE